MAAPASTEEFLDLVRKSGVADERRLNDYLSKARGNGNIAPDASRMAGYLIRDGLLTKFQAEQILQGKWRRFTIGKYEVLDKLGSGGMGAVYLCRHKLMRRHVAVKVLPNAKAADPSALARFYREARAVAALDHPNIVHAYDIDQDEQLHFLVMEWVYGSSFQDIIKKTGPMDIERACHYIRQAAQGLDHASRAHIVHRDIKPGNILLERTGIVKILDMGLARFFNDDEDNLTQKFEENVLGTADYLAPEQAVESHGVDIRADIYSLGATFYYLLTARTPFGEGTIAQKLLWHQSRQPRPVTDFRKDVRPGVSAVILKMMAKDANDRYQTPQEVADALEPFTQSPIGPPPESEMPQLSPAVLGNFPQEQVETTVGMRSDVPNTPKALQGMSPPPGSKSPSKSGAEAAPKSPSPKSPTPRSSSDGLAATSRTPGVSPGSRFDSPVPRSTPPSGAKANNTPAPAPAAPAPSVPEPVSTPPAAPGPALAEENPLAFLDGISEESTATSTADAPASAPPRSSPSNKGRSGPATEYRVRQMAIWFGGVFAVLAAAGVAGWFLFIRPTVTPPPPPGRQPLLVSADTTKKGPFRSVLLAIANAQKGDVIHLLDKIHEENLEVDFAAKPWSSEITIQAAPETQVTWMTKSKNLPAKPLLVLKGAANFTLKDLTFDGSIDAKNRVHRLVEVYLRSPGLTFESVRLHSFDVAALKIMNVFGDGLRPIRFKNLEVQSAPGENPQGGVLFDANPSFVPPTNDWLEFHDPQFFQVKAPFVATRKGVLGENVLGVSNLQILPEVKTPPKKAADPKKGPDPKKPPEAKKGPEVKKGEDKTDKTK